MDIRQLRNVLAIFDKGSIGKAAEALRVSQPALTKSLRRLEDELQVKLFVRTSRGMPTACARTPNRSAPAFITCATICSP